jgi:hypothetical protein
LLHRLVEYRMSITTPSSVLFAFVSLQHLILGFVKETLRWILAIQASIIVVTCNTQIAVWSGLNGFETVELVPSYKDQRPDCQSGLWDSGDRGTRPVQDQTKDRSWDWSWTGPPLVLNPDCSKSPSINGSRVKTVWARFLNT